MTTAKITAFAVAIAAHLTVVSAAPPSSPANPSGLDTARIEELTGAKGTLDAKEGVFKVSVPRSDLSVTAGGVHITPPLGITSWAAFQAAGAGHSMVMGDLVLLEDQVNPVMSMALDNGLEVTALHNHFFWDSPKVMFMHIGGMATQDALATAVGKVFAKIKETSGGAGEVLKADIEPTKSTLTTAKIDAAVGQKGDLSNGVYKITIGRTTRMHGHEVGKTMGVNTWAAFAARTTAPSWTATSPCSSRSSKGCSRPSARRASTSSPFTSTWRESSRGSSSFITGESARPSRWPRVFAARST